MPYIRLYSRDVPLEDKRLIAQKLIAITLESFQLNPEDRGKITVQFVPRNRPLTDSDVSSCLEPFDAVVEVADHDLTVEKISAFIEAATPVLSQSAAVAVKNRFARLLGFRANESRQVAFQFSDMKVEGESVRRVSTAGFPVRKAA